MGGVASRREGKWRDQGNKMTAEQHESEVRPSSLVESFSLAVLLRGCRCRPGGE